MGVVSRRSFLRQSAAVAGGAALPFVLPSSVSGQKAPSRKIGAGHPGACLLTDVVYFDCNASLGRRNIPPPGAPETAADLLTQMDHFGIDRALVTHAVAEELAPAEGNKMLMDEIAGQRRLTPCWVALPHHCLEMPPPEKMVGQMAAAHVRAVMMAPSLHGYHLGEAVLGELAAALQRRRIPLLLQTGRPAAGPLDWTGIIDLCQRHPKLPVVLLNPGHTVNRTLFALWKRFDNLYLDISRFDASGGLRFVCEHFGARRLLFGTQTPFVDPAGALTSIQYGGLAVEDARAIAGGNLARLLEEVRFDA